MPNPIPGEPSVFIATISRIDKHGVRWILHGRQEAETDHRPMRVEHGCRDGVGTLIRYTIRSGQFVPGDPDSGLICDYAHIEKRLSVVAPRPEDLVVEKPKERTYSQAEVDEMMRQAADKQFKQAQALATIRDRSK